jgi:thioredoxin reductase (NADPH)
MEIRTEEAIEEFIADENGKLAALKFKNVKSGNISEIKTDGAFLFIGLDPNTGWLNGKLELDERKFLKTNELFQTSIAGIFAAGDVRSGSTKQLAAAVGEGAAVAIQIRYFLDKMESQQG